MSSKYFVLQRRYVKVKHAYRYPFCDAKEHGERTLQSVHEIGVNVFIYRNRLKLFSSPVAYSAIVLCALATGAASASPSKMPTQPQIKQTQVKKPAPHWWPRSVAQRLSLAATNRPQLVAALRRVPVQQRDSLRFLLENMPETDLRTLSSKFLLDHVALAHTALAKAPWKQRIPRDIFLNDILPYASLNEKRDASFAVLRQKSLPLIAGCRTPGEAAQRLNEKLFPRVKVRYSTGRKRADQSPLESMASGIASCSGLSILLADACRSVGIPARVVGTPLWANMRGNHTWVEIWDGQWHFVGAAEPDAQGLNHGWFIADAAQAHKDIPQHAIYASSFKKTGIAFPLVWAPQIRWVNAVNVTERYAAAKPIQATDKTRVLIKVLDAGGKRASTKIVVTDLAGVVLGTGTSRNESSDLNDFLAFELPRGTRYKLMIGEDPTQYYREFKVEDKPEQLITVGVEKLSPLWTMQPAYVSPPITQSLPSQTASELKIALTKYFGATLKL